MWTIYFDMSSGGYEKTPHTEIWVNDDRNRADEIFENKFGFSPYGMTCACCGPDYSISTETEDPPPNVYVITE